MQNLPAQQEALRITLEARAAKLAKDPEPPRTDLPAMLKKPD